MSYLSMVSGLNCIIPHRPPILLETSAGNQDHFYSCQGDTSQPTEKRNNWEISILSYNPVKLIFAPKTHVRRLIHHTQIQFSFFNSQLSGKDTLFKYNLNFTIMHFFPLNNDTNILHHLIIGLFYILPSCTFWDSQYTIVIAFSSRGRGDMETPRTAASKMLW